MENPTRVVLIEQDYTEKILNVTGTYSYKEALDILEQCCKKFGGKLYVPKGNYSWAFEWHCEDYNETYWAIIPIDGKFKHPLFK